MRTLNSLCLLLLLICSHSTVSGQFLPFGAPGSSWKVDYFDADLSAQCAGTRTSIYAITDTVFYLGQTYKSISYTTRGVCRIEPGFQTICGYGLDSLLLRTDTATGQVLGWVQGDVSESIFFDYSLQVSDTVDPSHRIAGFASQPLVVDSVDYVMLGGQQRKRLFYTNGNGILIEGIGTSTGFGYPFGNGVNGETATLSCYSEFGFPIYENPTSCSSNGDCLALDRPGPISHTQLRISPNPSSDVVRYEFHPFRQPMKISVYDMSGKIWWRAEGHDGLIPVAEWPAGLYFLRNGDGNSGMFQVMH